MKNVYISPIKAVLYDLADASIDYIICTMNSYLQVDECDNILFLNFMDTTERNNPYVFKTWQAEKIREFLCRPMSNKDVFVCCDSGESRSPALAAAILLFYGQSDWHIWNSMEYHPNEYVFKLQCRSFGIKMNDCEICERKQIK